MDWLTVFFSGIATIIAYLAYRHSKQSLWITKNIDIYFKRIEMYENLMCYLKAQCLRYTAVEKFLGCFDLNSSVKSSCQKEFSSKVILKIVKDYFGEDIMRKTEKILQMCSELRREDSDMKYLLFMLETDCSENNIELVKYKDAMMKDGCEFNSEEEQEDINRLLDNLQYFDYDEYHLGGRERYDYRTIEHNIGELSSKIDDSMEELSDMILGRIPFDQPQEECILSKKMKIKL